MVWAYGGRSAVRATSFSTDTRGVSVRVLYLSPHNLARWFTNNCSTVWSSEVQYEYNPEYTYFVFRPSSDPMLQCLPRPIPPSTADKKDAPISSTRKDTRNRLPRFGCQSLFQVANSINDSNYCAKMMPLFLCTRACQNRSDD